MDQTQPSTPPSTKTRLVVRKMLLFVLWFFVVLVVVVGGFVLYAWLSPKEAAVATLKDPKPKAQLQTQAKVTVDPNSPVGVSVQSITSPVEPGSNVSLSIKTKATATCKIEVEYNKVKSTDSGLSEKVADDFGLIQWSWSVASTVPEGSWPVTVTCSMNKKSGIVIHDLVVKKAEA